LQELLRLGYVPVVAPIAVDTGERAQLLNTNADTAAGEIAAALGAARLVFLTDVAGVLDEHKDVIPCLTSDEARTLIASGVAGGGMIPKLEAALRAAARGCETHVIDGTRAGTLAAAIAGVQTGTKVGDMSD
jgi:acetylglutamate kinase